MNANDSNKYDLAPSGLIIQRSPFAIGAAIVGLVDAFVWGLRLAMGRIIQVNPLGTYELSYYLGLTSYALLALFFVLSSAVILHNGFKKSQWSSFERNIFYLGVFLGIIYLMSGFEYLFWMDWQYVNPVPFIMVKSAFVGLAVVFLIRMLNISWLKF
jgi:hypothetical protein